MTVRVSCATGNFTTAGTWKAIETATSFSNSEAGSTATTTSFVTSATFTPGAIVIDAIGIKIAARTASPSGTFSVQLMTGGSAVSGTTVTINAADLPAITSAAALDGGWHVFKLASNVTLVAATAYSVAVSSSVAGTVTVFRTATAGDWSRFLRTTTTGAPAAGDDLIVAGEYTGAGTSNTYTVTMDSTAATAYGSQPVVANSLFTPAVAVCNKGTLAYGTTASTNYVLRLNGCCIVYRGGTFNIGTVATPIPRTGTAVLEFGQAATGADGDYGLIIRDGATWTSQGLSRTSGKNIDRCLLSGGGAVNAAGTSVLLGFTGTLTASSAIVTSVSAAAFGTFAVGDAIGQHNATGNIPAGTTILGYIDNLGNAFGDTSGLASSQIKMSANSASSGVQTSAIYTNAFGGSKLLTIDTDTGWLSGDQIAVGSTTRTAADCETGVLTSNASGTQLAVQGFVAAATGQTLPLAGTGGLLTRHDGVSPVQAEVILLTRNVKIRSTSATLMSYVKIGNSSVAPTVITVDVDWTEFYYCGTTTTDKRGVDIDSNTGCSISLQYCSVHDAKGAGLQIGTFSGATQDGLTFSNNVLWNCSTSGGSMFTFQNAVSGVTWVMDSNIFMRTLASNCVTLGDIGGTFTNNKAIGAASVGMSFSESTASFGNFSGNIAHSCASTGVSCAGTAQSGVISNTTVWRNTSSGVALGNNFDLTFDTAAAWGNGTPNLALSGTCDLTLKAITSSGDSSFATSTGLGPSTSNIVARVLLDGCSFGSVSGIKAAHTQDLNINLAFYPQIVLRNTLLASTTEVAAQTSMTANAYISSQKHDQTAGNHKTWKRDGVISSDATIYKTASPSERLAPTWIGSSALLGLTSGSNIATPSAGNFALFGVVGRIIGSNVFASNPAPPYVTAVSPSNGTITLSSTATTTASSSVFVCSPLRSGSKLVAVASGGSATIGVWVRQSVAGDGAGYTASSAQGAPPRLVQLANPALGVTADTVRATGGTTRAVWEQLTYTITNSSGDDAVFEFCVDAAGTAGWVNVDDWSVT